MSLSLGLRSWIHRNLVWVVPLVLFCLLRLPSFFEPQWYADEAGYASTAWFMHLGRILYVTAWNQKPPFLYLLYQGTVSFLGTSEASLHVLSMIGGTTTLLAGMWALSMLVSRKGYWIGSLALVVAIGTPIFDGELSLPESLLIGPVSLGMVLFLKYFVLQEGPSRRGTVTLIAIGACLAAGALIQQTALGDAIALSLFCLFRAKWKELLIIVLTMVLIASFLLAPFVHAAGIHASYYAMVKSFVPYVMSSLNFRLTSLAFRGIVVVLLVCSGFLNRRSNDVSFEFIRLWATTMLIVAIAPGYPYEHFLLPATLPTVLLVAMAASRYRSHWKKVYGSRRTFISALVLVFLIADAPLVFNQADWFTYHADFTARYYPEAAMYALHVIDTKKFDAFFGPENYGFSQADQWVADHHLEGSTAVVWSSLSWAYVDERLIPYTISGPLYVTESVENGTATLFAKMQAEPPRLIYIDFTTGGSYKKITRFVQQHGYHLVYSDRLIVLYYLPGSP